MFECAFHGNVAIKDDALARLRAHIANGTFFWNDPGSAGTGASAITSATEGVDDPEAFAEKLGFPVALAFALDEIVNCFPSLPELADFAVAWLDRTEVGADLSGVVSETVVAILTDPGLAAITSRDRAVDQARREVADLHRRFASGQSVNRQEWKAARSVALAASDAASEPVVREAAAVAEAAAWPPTMRSVLVDVLSANLRRRIADLFAEIGWTDHAGPDSDEARLFAIIEATNLPRDEMNDLSKLHAVLEAGDPDFAKKFRQRLAQFDKGLHVTRDAAYVILNRLAAAKAGQRAA